MTDHQTVFEYQWYETRCQKRCNLLQKSSESYQRLKAETDQNHSLARRAEIAAQDEPPDVLIRKVGILVKTRASICREREIRQNLLATQSNSQLSLR